VQEPGLRGRIRLEEPQQPICDFSRSRRAGVRAVFSEIVPGSDVPSRVAFESTSPHRVFTQIAGDALRIEAAAFNAQCKKLPALGRTMTNYQQAFLFQISQCVACNGLHVIIERCCRWLLQTHDRVDGDDVLLTHEFLSYMRGVRRASVTEVLLSLQQQQPISYGHGQIRVLDRNGLENLVCECYQLVRDEYDRLLNGRGDRD